MVEETMERVLERIEQLARWDFDFPFDEDGDTMEIHLFSREEFPEGQLGYRVDDLGNCLIQKDNVWKASWYVIGYEGLLGDPIVVDIQDTNLPVFIFAQDVGWEPLYLANSLEAFLTKVYETDFI